MKKSSDLCKTVKVPIAIVEENKNFLENRIINLPDKKIAEQKVNVVQQG